MMKMAPDLSLLSMLLPIALALVLLISSVNGTTPSEMRDMAGQGQDIASSMSDQLDAAMSGNMSDIMDTTAATINRTAGLGNTVFDDIALGIQRTMDGENPWVDNPPPPMMSDPQINTDMSEETDIAPEPDTESEAPFGVDWSAFMESDEAEKSEPADSEPAAESEPVPSAEIQTDEDIDIAPGDIEVPDGEAVDGIVIIGGSNDTSSDEEISESEAEPGPAVESSGSEPGPQPINKPDSELAPKLSSSQSGVHNQASPEGMREVYLCGSVSVPNENAVKGPDGEDYVKLAELVLKWDGSSWAVAPDGVPKEAVAGR